MGTRGLPEKVSEETRRRNPHLYPPTHTGPPKTFSDIPTKAQATKYHAQKTTTTAGADCRAFDSKAEADRYIELQALERAGTITGLRCQPQYHLTEAQIGYRADFEYQESGTTIAEDVKGVMTDRFRLISKLWKVYGPHPLRITKRRGSTFVTKDQINPNTGFTVPKPSAGSGTVDGLVGNSGGHQ